MSRFEPVIMAGTFELSTFSSWIVTASTKNNVGIVDFLLVGNFVYFCTKFYALMQIGDIKFIICLYLYPTILLVFTLYLIIEYGLICG